MDIELTAKVTAVTVYSHQARVSVEANVTLESGAHRLIVGDLPLTLDAASVRAGGSGSAVVRVHSVEVRRHHFVDTPANNVRDIEAEIETMEDELRAIDDEREIVDAQGRYLEGLRGASEQFARGLALGRTSVEQQERISLFFQDQDQALHHKARELDRRTREVDRVLDKLRRELAQVDSARPRERNQAILEVEVVDAGEFRTELVYNVNRASWKPLYDIRLVENDAEPALQISGLAQITQNSGQDWLDVDLKVSTARAELNQRQPELKPWYVDVLPPPIPRAAPAQFGVTAAPQAVHSDDMAVGRMERAAEPVTADVITEDGGATVTFEIARKGNIPSDGSPHKTILFERRFSADVDHIAVPKHTDAVFRRLKAANDGTIPLLAGTTQLFVGERFIGTSKIDYVPVGDELELMLGVEERLTIERELVRREVDKMRLRDKRQIQYGYAITVKNLLADEASIEIQDHIPVSRHEDIKIKLIGYAPEPVEHDEMNLMKWHLVVAGGAESKVNYQYQVEHPRSMKVIGLIE